MEKVVARFFSFLLHPLLMPTYLMLILFQSESFLSFALPLESKIRILSILFIITFVLPVIMVLLLIWSGRGNVKSIQMEEREERNIPFVSTAIMFYLTYHLFNSIQVPILQLLSVFMLGSAILIIIVLLVNLRWKISAHMTGIGALTSTLLLISLTITPLPLFVLATFLCAGIIAFARLSLQSHSPAQVYAGYMLGFGIMSFVFGYLI